MEEFLRPQRKSKATRKLEWDRELLPTHISGLEYQDENGVESRLEDRQFLTYVAVDSLDDANKVIEILEKA
jgi:hypothetical protein